MIMPMNEETLNVVRVMIRARNTPEVESRADATWSGDLIGGAGSVRPASGAFAEQPLTWRQRSESRESGTSPEERTVLRKKAQTAGLTDAAMVGISATAIRGAARAGESERLRQMVPTPVADYIEKYELYRN